MLLNGKEEGSILLKQKALRLVLEKVNHNSNCNVDGCTNDECNPTATEVAPQEGEIKLLI